MIIKRGRSIFENSHVGIYDDEFTVQLSDHDISSGQQG